MKHIRIVSLAALGALAAGSSSALAHTGVPGHVHTGLAAGLLHPLGGVDHLIAMLAVGIWSALSTSGRSGRVWAAPAAFVSAMLAGSLAGSAGLPIPLVEAGIAFSIVTLGLMIVARVSLSAIAGAALVGTFALFHGYAHGAEAAAGSLTAFMAGFALTTSGLHVGGIVLGRLMLEHRRLTSLLGGLMAVTGAYLLSA